LTKLDRCPVCDHFSVLCCGLVVDYDQEHHLSHAALVLLMQQWLVGQQVVVTLKGSRSHATIGAPAMQSASAG